MKKYKENVEIKDAHPNFVDLSCKYIFLPIIYGLFAYTEALIIS
jgi:hypothetical protein